MNWKNVTADELASNMYQPGDRLLVDDAIEVIILDDNTLAWRTNTEEMDGEWQLGATGDVVAELT